MGSSSGQASGNVFEVNNADLSFYSTFIVSAICPVLSLLLVT